MITFLFGAVVGVVWTSHHIGRNLHRIIGSMSPEAQDKLMIKASAYRFALALSSYTKDQP